MPTYLTLDQVSERLHAPRETVRYWCRTGKLPAYKPGRVLLIREPAGRVATFRGTREV